MFFTFHYYWFHTTGLDHIIYDLIGTGNLGTVFLLICLTHSVLEIPFNIVIKITDYFFNLL